jgi:MFS family permease
MQNYFKGQGKTEFEIAIVLAIGAGVAAIFATQTYKLEKILSLPKLVAVASLIAIVGFWGMTIQSIAPYAFFLLTAAEGVMFVSMSDFINKQISSEKRATILSFQSMIFSAFMIILFPVVGKLGDWYGLADAFRWVAVLATVILLIMVRIIGKRKTAFK